MPTETRFKYDHRELTSLLIQKAGVKEGHWQLDINFTFAAATMGPSEAEVIPTAIVGVSGVGIARVDAPTPLSVDASAIAEN